MCVCEHVRGSVLYVCVCVSAALSAAIGLHFWGLRHSYVLATKLTQSVHCSIIVYTKINILIGFSAF